MKKLINIVIIMLLINTSFMTFAMGILGEDEENTLIFMREEEKFARDVYLAFDEQWDNRVFRNIIRSEEQHMRILATELSQYDIQSSVAEPGVFTNATLQKLYDELTLKGSNSLQDALMVAAYVEEMDIQDLEEAIAKTNKSNLIEAYNTLLEGSYRHLQAFVRQIEKMGITYTAQILSPDEVNAILGADMRGSHHRGKHK